MTKRNLLIGLGLALALAAGSAKAGAVRAPKVSISSYAQLRTPLPYPYDEAAKADQQVARAKARAKASGKMLLIDLGGNWCGDCRILAATLALPEMRTFMARHFEMVTVDVGRFDKNLQIPAHYGITRRLEGVPALLVVDPRTDRLVNKDTVASLADARHMSPQALANWIAQWARP
jgi:thiol-disulfide isomerase/thioredoxin